MLPIGKLEMNVGQLEIGGEKLPTNPRQFGKREIDSMAKSLKETPQLFEDRPCLVYKMENGHYCIIGGNLRYLGAKANNMKMIPCIVHENEPLQTIKELVIKDNGEWGEWDVDALANEWDDLPLKDWGVDVAIDTENIKDTDDFVDRFNRLNNENSLYPIVPEYDEEAEVFLIVSRTKTDSNWLREKLGMQKMKSYKSDDVAKSNVISIEDLKDVL